jgi:hypothetical protein
MRPENCGGGAGRAREARAHEVARLSERRSQAASIGRYDARGVCRFRRRSVSRSFDFQSPEVDRGPAQRRKQIRPASVSLQHNQVERFEAVGD